MSTLRTTLGNRLRVRGSSLGTASRLLNLRQGADRLGSSNSSRSRPTVPGDRCCVAELRGTRLGLPTKTSSPRLLVVPRASGRLPRLARALTVRGRQRSQSDLVEPFVFLLLTCPTRSNEFGNLDPQNNVQPFRLLFRDVVPAVRFHGARVFTTFSLHEICRSTFVRYGKRQTDGKKKERRDGCEDLWNRRVHDDRKSGNRSERSIRPFRKSLVEWCFRVIE